MRESTTGRNMRTMLKAGLIIVIALDLCVSSAAIAKTIYVFHGRKDGGNPDTALIADGSGNLFGAAGGGANSGGIVFRINPDGTKTVLYAFCGLQNCADGSEPNSTLVADPSGNLYGTTSYGGNAYKGTVFKLAPDGTETVIYSFQNNETDGMNPQGEIAMDASGNIYGTTVYGAGQGSVFKVSPKGKETILHGFGGYPFDGGTPWGGVVVDKSGNVFGTTEAGGNSAQCPSGCGLVFKIAPDGTETILHTFAFSDGAEPYGTVTIDNSGNVYGITTGGGSTGRGTVFKVDAGGTFTSIYSFAGGTDGDGPYGYVILDPSGNLYGTTVAGGDFGQGTVFRVTAGGTETLLHSFTGTGRDGAQPDCGLLLSASRLYGTTTLGGQRNAGTVFDLRK